MFRVFTSMPKRLGTSELRFPSFDLLDVPLLRSCDLDYAFVHGGDIIRSIIADLPDEWKNSTTVVSAKVHHLVNTYYPAPKGWHSDIYLTGHGVTEDDLKIRHMNVWFGDDISRTEYISGKLYIPEYIFDLRGWDFWNALDRVGDDAVAKNLATIVSSEQGEFIENDAETLHRATPSVGSGVRLFLKFNTGEPVVPSNKIAKFSQVYIPT